MRIKSTPLTFALVLLVLTSTFAPFAFTQNASAAETDQCVSKVTGKAMQCGVDYGSLSGQTVEETWLSMHVTSESMHDRYQRYTVEKASISNLTTGMMTEEGMAAFIKAYNNREGKTQAKVKGVNAVNDFASGMQASVAYEQTAQAEMVRVMHTEANGTSGMTVGDVFPIASNNHEFVFENRTATLYNGTKINVTAVAAIDQYWHNNEQKDDYIYTWYDGDYSRISGYSDYGGGGHETHLQPLNVRGPPSVDGETVFAVDPKRTKWTLEIIDSNRKVAIDNVQAFGDSFAAQYEPGEVTVEEFMSPTYRLRHHATQYDSTGRYAALLLYAQDRGMAVDVETGFTVKYNQSGPMAAKTIDGGLYATEGTFAPHGGIIESDVQYSVNNLSGTVWVIDANTSRQTMLNGTFTVLEMRDVENGTVINQTSLQSTSFATRSADGFKQDVENFSKVWEKQQKIEQTHNLTTNVAITWPWEGESDWLGLPDVDGQTIGLVLLGAIGLLFGVAFLISALKPY